MRIKIYQFLFLFLFLFSALLSASQNMEDSQIENIPDYDTNYFRSYTDHLGLFTFAARKYRSYGLKNKELDTKLKFAPNGQTNVGLGFNYKWINLGVSTSFDFMNKDNHKYGETTRFDLQLNAFSRYLGLNAHYQKYTGFYLSNPEDLTDWQQKFYPYLSDLQSSSFGLSLFYVFNNKKFSYKAAYIRNEVQKKSVGSIILGAYSDFDVVFAPSGFIPEELPDSLKPHFDFNGYSTAVFGLSFGYTYTFVVLKQFFINLSLVPGLGYRTLSIWYISSNKKTEPNLTGTLNTRMSAGYEGKHFYFGVSSYASNESFKYESVDISSNSGLLRFYLGKRFQGKKHKQLM